MTDEGNLSKSYESWGKKIRAHPLEGNRNLLRQWKQKELRFQRKNFGEAAYFYSCFHPGAFTDSAVDKEAVISTGR